MAPTYSFTDDPTAATVGSPFGSRRVEDLDDGALVEVTLRLLDPA